LSKARTRSLSRAKEGRWGGRLGRLSKKKKLKRHERGSHSEGGVNGTGQGPSEKVCKENTRAPRTRKNGGEDGQEARFKEKKKKRKGGKIKREIAALGKGNQSIIFRTRQLSSHGLSNQ